MKKIIYFTLAFTIITVLLLTAKFVSAENAITASSNSYQQAKDNYQNKIKEYTSVRQGWLTAKNLYNKSRSAADLEQALIKAKTHVVKVNEVIYQYLVAIKTKVEVLEDIDSATKQNIISEINSDLNWLENEKTEINNVTKKDSLLTAVATMKQRWEDVRARARKYVGHVLVARLNQVIANLETARDKAHDKVNLIQQSGQSTAKLDNLLVNYTEKINLAKGQLSSAEAKFNQISSASNAVTLFREGRELVNAAKNYAREAWGILQSIITELRQVNLNTNT